MSKLLIVYDNNKTFSETLSALKTTKFEEVILLCDATVNITMAEISNIFESMYGQNVKPLLYFKEPELYFELGRLADKNTTLICNLPLPEHILNCFAKQNTAKKKAARPATVRKPRTPKAAAEPKKPEPENVIPKAEKTVVKKPEPVLDKPPKTLSKKAKAFLSCTGLSIEKIPNFEGTDEDLAQKILQVFIKDTNRNRIQLEINKAFGSFNGDYIWASVCYSIDKLHALALEV